MAAANAQQASQSRVDFVHLAHAAFCYLIWSYDRVPC